MWDRLGVFAFPADVSDAVKDDVAQIISDVTQLETPENERLMFDKAQSVSNNNSATVTHFAVRMALTPALADALANKLRESVDALPGLRWYILDAADETIIDTNDNRDNPLLWQPGLTVTTGQVYDYQNTLYSVVISHTTQADWTPLRAPNLFTPWRDPNNPAAWVQPTGAHDAYPAGFAVYHLPTERIWISDINANVWEPNSAANTWTLRDDQEPLVPDPGGEVAEWVSGEAGIQPGDQRRYQGVVYEAIQNPGVNIWPPPTVPALWQPV